MKCPIDGCLEPMVTKPWVKNKNNYDILVATCLFHQIRKFYDTELGRFLTHMETQELKKDWE